jgi:NAD-dependent deacetylase
LVRPEVVLFGEMLPLDRTRVLQTELMRGFDAVFSIGTTSVFPYIAEPVLDARRRGGLTVEINPGTSEVSHLVDYRLRTGAAAAMDAVVQALDRP